MSYELRYQDLRIASSDGLNFLVSPRFCAESRKSAKSNLGRTCTEMLENFGRNLGLPDWTTDFYFSAEKRFRCFLKW